MREDIFDNIIKDKLEGYTSYSKTGDPWSAFESFEAKNKQITEDKSQTDFDVIIKSSLMRVTPIYRNDHWQILKNKLKTIEERKNTIFISKIMEFAAIFLIVFTYFQWSGYLNENNNRQKDILQYANMDFAQAEGSQIKSEKTTVNHNLKKEKEAATSYFELKEINNAKVGLVKPINDINSDKIIFANAGVPNKEVWHSEGLLNLDDHSNKVENATVEGFDPKSLIFELQSLEAKELKSDLSNQREILAINTLNNPIKENLISEFAIAIPMQLTIPSQKPEFALSVFSSGDINLINTPFDKLYSKASYNKEALNNSFGLNISKKMDKLEMETGLGYAKREYQPLLIKEAFGLQENSYSEISLNKISYDLATIPLNFKYHFIDQVDWGAYIIAGATLNLVMNADYEKPSIEIMGRPSPDRHLPEAARLEEKPFIKGLLSGDSFKDTYFASVGFGFGIQKKLFNNTSIYVQPTYHRHVLSGDIGIGPNKDKIHTSSLQFGVKTILN